MRQVTPRTREICDRYKRGLELGEPSGELIGELSAMYDVQRPAIWKCLRNGGIIAPYSPRLDGGRGRPQGGGSPGYTEERRRRSQIFKDRQESLASAPRVDRDPCQRCGVRHDIGCHHSRAPIGMIL